MSRLFSNSTLAEQKLLLHADRQRWLGVGVLTLLLHLALLLIPWHDILPKATPVAPPRVAIEPMSQDLLEQIRATNKNRKLLLSKDENAPDTEKSDNPDARYFSDRTRFVEQEIRATNTRAIPDPASGGGDTYATGAPRPQKSVPDRALDLSSLGLPMNFEAEKGRRSDNTRFQGYGADQALVDENDLPPGAENLLNTQRSVYYSYFSRLAREIAPIWEQRIQSTAIGKDLPVGDYVTVVEIAFNSEGTLVGMNFEKPQACLNWMKQLNMRGKLPGASRTLRAIFWMQTIKCALSGALRCPMKRDLDTTSGVEFERINLFN